MDKNISNLEIARAATNDPALSAVSFNLGDRSFKIVDLAYDDYVKFLALLAPLLESVAKKFLVRDVLAVEGESVSVADLFKYCVDGLPEMVCIVCSQTDPTIKVDDVKRLGKNPINLARIVLLQIQQNNVIKDIGDFFVQTLPLMKAAMGAMTGGTRS
jgi:hypothetical protein